MFGYSSCDILAGLYFHSAGHTSSENQTPRRDPKAENPKIERGGEEGGENSRTYLERY